MSQPKQPDRNQPSPNPSHPLLGADLLTLIRVTGNNGPVPPASRRLLLSAAGAALGRLPLTLAEQAYARLMARRRPMAAPVFIVGHWRSGTTHLYNTLSRSPRFGFVSPVATGLPWDFLFLGRLLRPWLERALPENRFVDRIPVNPDSPQEDEIALASMQELSFYHGIYFPSHLQENFRKGLFFEGCSEQQVRRWRRRFRLYMEKLAIAQPGTRLLIKNPVYTARVRMLQEIWPDARFIHIYRNPYVVFQSTRNFYRALLREFALQPYNPDDAEQLILESYPRMRNRVLEDTQDLPPGQFSEIRYETLEQAPLETLARVYEELELDGFEQDRPRFARYLQEVSSYRKNAYAYPEADNQKVLAHWGPFLERWGYEPPGRTGSGKTETGKKARQA